MRAKIRADYRHPEQSRLFSLTSSGRQGILDILTDGGVSKSSLQRIQEEREKVIVSLKEESVPEDEVIRVQVKIGARTVGEDQTRPLRVAPVERDGELTFFSRLEQICDLRLLASIKPPTPASVAKALEEVCGSWGAERGGVLVDDETRDTIISIVQEIVHSRTGNLISDKKELWRCDEKELWRCFEDDSSIRAMVPDRFAYSKKGRPNVSPNGAFAYAIARLLLDYGIEVNSGHDHRYDQFKSKGGILFRLIDSLLTWMSLPVNSPRELVESAVARIKSEVL